MLPLDLHVLSLPLAFILSQDQTLHSKFLVKITRKSNPLFCPSLVRLTFLSASSPAVSMNVSGNFAPNCQNTKAFLFSGFSLPISRVISISKFRTAKVCLILAFTKQS